MSTEISEPQLQVGISTNPFPGLRPFDVDESHLFFGREGQSEQLTGKLSRTHFLAVVGTSGSGKSSLVRAGFLPALQGGFMTKAGSGWQVAMMRPGNDPIGNLARALNAPEVFGSEIEENVAIQTAIAEATLRRGGLGLVDTVRQAGLPGNGNLLVVVDQFEEIFRFAGVTDVDRYENEAAAFIKLLLEASRQREIPIYVVLTMRSDYLGDCSQFWDLPEAINESQYLIPRLTRDQLREAITGPVAVGGGRITPRLVNRLLNDVGDNQDQLPVLQHLLMRSWDEWKEQRLEIESKDGESTVRRPHKELHEGDAIDLCCAEAVGGMTQALSRHADEAFNDLPDERHRDLSEKLFKSLTEKGSDNREIRRPITLGEICVVAGATEAEITTIIDTFRQPGRSFLMPPSSIALNAESLIDISHESLIRRWARLTTWVDEESRSARIYRRLAETAVLYKEGGAGLWRDPDLQVALTWRDQSKPNETWARRYHPEFGLAMSFLDESVAARKAQELEREQQRHQETRYKRTRIVAGSLGFFFLLSLGALTFAVTQTTRANAARAAALAESNRAEVARRDALDQKEKADLARKDAVDQKVKADTARKDAIDQKEKADRARRDAIALQTKVATLERQKARMSNVRANKAQQETAEEKAINTLTRELKDELANGNADVVITKATQLLDLYKKRPDPRGVYESLTVLGPVYLKQGQSAEARASAEEALKLQEAGDISDQRGEHENVAVLRDAYLKEGNLVEAFTAGLRSLRVQEGFLGANNQVLIPELNSLASVSESRGQPDTSEGFRQRIVNIQRQALQADNEQLATYLNNLANFYQARGDYAKAETQLMEVLAIQEKTLKPDEPQLVSTLNHLVALYRYEKKDADADLLVKRIQGIQGQAAILQKGTSGPEVVKLQLQLQKVGFYNVSADGIFGQITEAAVKEFQSRQGLVADGIAGAQTIALMNQSQATGGLLELQNRLKKLGFYSGEPDGMLGLRTEAAVKAFQQSKGLFANGAPNQETLEALGLLTPTKASSITGKVTVEIVSQMFPGTPIDNIRTNLPYVLKALEDDNLTDKDMVLVTLATIRADMPGFQPISEYPSRFNTSQGGRPFDLYDNRKALGNQGPPDGEKFKGRGFSQITGRSWYAEYGAAIGLGNQLVENPDLANQPEISAKILASMLKKNVTAFRKALLTGDLRLVRRLINGGSQGLDEFTRAFNTGKSLLQ